MKVLYGRVIDAVADEALENGMVVVDGERIVYVGERGGYPVSDSDEVFETEDGTIMPGFIDAHAHLVGSESVHRTGDSPYELLLTTVRDLQDLVDAGITGVRDMSAFGSSLKKAIEAGNIVGPRIMPGGRVMSISSGHCDFDPLMSREDVNRRDLTGCLVDGPEECYRMTRQQFREGAQFIKICATGGVSSAIDDFNDIEFSPEEIRVIVEEAARHNTYVTAHCTGTAGAKEAIKNGVMCIEHGVILDEECVQLMAEKNIPLVTTLSVSLGIADMKGLPEHMMKKAAKLGDSSKRSFELAHRYGIRVALGTDYSNSPNTPFREIGKEFYSLTRCGYSNMEAIKAGTINGAYLMKSDHEFGSVEAGKLADLVIVKGNPLEDIMLLAHADHIGMVMIGGDVKKNCL
ncbi:MAG: amidohydrolase family protein [Lachnospiraceae bacterium]|nr:amidohydrolase family protein [Lachnospiraceae bacterium]